MSPSNALNHKHYAMAKVHANLQVIFLPTTCPFLQGEDLYPNKWLLKEPRNVCTYQQLLAVQDSAEAESEAK